MFFFCFVSFILVSELSALTLFIRDETVLTMTSLKQGQLSLDLTVGS